MTLLFVAWDGDASSCEKLISCQFHEAGKLLSSRPGPFRDENKNVRLFFILETNLDIARYPVSGFRGKMSPRAKNYLSISYPLYL